MTLAVQLVQATSQRIAAVQVSVAPGGIGAVWRPALDQVWRFLRLHPELAPGQNLFLYHHPPRPGAAMAVDFGVQVAGDFTPDGNVRGAVVPAGPVARALHVGPMDRISETHAAIHDWCREHGHQIGGTSWESYGDWGDDPAQYEVWITYLLA